MEKFKNLKKLLTSLFAFVLVITGAICLTACDTTQEKEIITEIVVLDQLNLNKVYDGKPVEEPFIYSIIAEQEFEYSVDWYQGDTKLTESPVNAGQYKLSITINYGEKTETLEKEFEIEKCKVKVPELRNLTYNGEMQEIFEYYDNDIMKIEGTTMATFGSNLEAEISLRDSVNYAWEDGVVGDRHYTASVSRKILDAVIEVNKENDGTNVEYIKLTTEHGLVEKDCNKGLYLVVEFESAEIGAGVTNCFVAFKKNGIYTPINITNSAGVQYHYMYDVQYEATGKIV